MSNELEDLRKSIDNIDNALIYLLAERFRVTQKVGEYKKREGLPPIDKSRERLQFERITELAKEADLNPEFATTFLRIIIDAVVRNHKDIQKH